KIQVLAGYELMRLDAKEQPRPPVRDKDDTDAKFAERQQRFKANLARFNAKKASFDALNDWLNTSITGGESPPMDTYVNTLVAFFNQHCKNYDGISFDIEGLGPTGSNTVDQMAKAVSKFYGKIADAIWPKIVAVANGALVSATAAFNNYK